MSRNESPPFAGGRRGRAVVVGAGMAGLLATRVLADAYTEVLLVERDELPDGDTPRRGVPQGHHAHGLLARGQQILEELFPGFTERLRAEGALTGDLGRLRWFFGGRRLAPADTGLIAVAATRPLLERLVRERVAELPNVRILAGRTVTGLVADEGGARVRGVQLQPTRGGRPTAERADLVVDASGRGSGAVARLGELGYARPAEDRIPIDLSYTTRYYRLPEHNTLGADQSINPVAYPGNPRGAFFSELENKLHILSLTGILGERAPTDPEGFEEYARQVPAPDVAEAVRHAEPISDPVQIRYPASVRRHYGRSSRLPAGLLTVGDAVCSFNPVYGQGMTVAALEAVLLRDHLAAGGEPDPVRFQQDVAGLIDVPWQISAGGDLAFTGVPGRRTPMTRFMNAYIARLHAAAAVDGSLTDAFMRVAGLIDPPQKLMSPGVAWKVWRFGGKARRTGAGIPAAGPPVLREEPAAQQ